MQEMTYGAQKLNPSGHQSQAFQGHLLCGLHESTGCGKAAVEGWGRAFAPPAVVQLPCGQGVGQILYRLTVMQLAVV